MLGLQRGGVPAGECCGACLMPVDVHSKLDVAARCRRHPKVCVLNPMSWNPARQEAGPRWTAKLILTAGWGKEEV